MQIDQLCVINYTKARSTLGPIPEQVLEHVLEPALQNDFFLESCQRKLWITSQTAFKKTALSMAEMERYSVFFGHQAYEVLLRIATGLESKLIGETEIFGQLKTAWKQFEKKSQSKAAKLQPIFQALFEDAKEIRNQYMQNLGSMSYGSLLRKVIAPSSNNCIAVFGAGLLAESVLPYLSTANILLLNRTPSSAYSLIEKYKKNSPLSQIEFSEKFDLADHLVFCVPFDSQQFELTCSKWFSQSHFKLKGTDRKIVHMGTQEQLSLPRSIPTTIPVFSLGDLLDLQAESKENRQEQLRHAKSACETRALLRSLNSSVQRPRAISIAHGWEDLALFA